MITLSESAAGKVKELLVQEGRSDIALRVAVQPGGCSGLRYAMYLDDEVGDADVAAEQFGVRVVVDRMSVPGHVGGHCAESRKVGQFGVSSV